MVLEQERPLEISLTAVQTNGMVSEDIGFGVSAAGPILLGIVVTYGDGAVDSVGTMGAVTAAANLSHAYMVAGTYVVTATVWDVHAATATDAVTIDVQ